MTHEDLLDDLFDLDIKKDKPTRDKLEKYIKDTYEFIKNSNITDWQKVKLDYAVVLYKDDHLDACRVYLIDVFTHPEEISKENRHLENLRKWAEKVDLNELIRTL